MALLPEEALRTKAMAVSGLSAAINGQYGADQVTQRSVAPYIVARVQSGGHITHLTGQSGFWRGTISLFIVGGTAYETARAIGETLRKALNGFAGNVTVGADTERIDNLIFEKEESASFDPGDGGSVLVKAWQQDWKLIITQPTA